MSAPAHIPDHELVAPIGHGSYGAVWLARSVTGARRAVKIVPRGAGFGREFEALQHYEPVSHSAEGLVHVLHVGRAADDAHFFYVMELADALDGDGYAPRTLRAEIQRRGALPPDECVKIALALSRALAALRDVGDAAGWREFFETYWELIYRVARRSILGDADAQETVQETMLSVAKQMPGFRYDPAQGRFKAWLLRVVHRRVADFWRAAAARLHSSSEGGR